MEAVDHKDLCGNLLFLEHHLNYDFWGECHCKIDGILKQPMSGGNFKD